MVPTWPIPSYNVIICGTADFREDYQLSKYSPQKERREIHVVAKPSGNTHRCEATVWIYSLDGKTTLGPYTIECGETLTVEIDDREWGALVQSEDEVCIDVWITP